MIKPIKIFGNWSSGFVLDHHVERSEFLGYDENGREKFETTRTELGELVYRIKYKGERQKTSELLDMIRDFLDKSGIKDMADIIIPVPPTKRNRTYQPVFEIASTIGKYLEKPVEIDILEKRADLQAKDGYTDIEGSIVKNKDFENPINVLVVDDLYNTGNTLNDVANALKTDKHVKNIYVLVMTKTKG